MQLLYYPRKEQLLMNQKNKKERLVLPNGEYRFAELIWNSEPINSTELVRLAGEQLGWKKATVYTVLRKLCEKNIMKNEHAIVTSLIPKEEIQSNVSIDFMEKNFHNSIPEFLTAFLKDRKLSKKEAEEIQTLIEEASYHENSN